MSDTGLPAQEAKVECHRVPGPGDEQLLRLPLTNLISLLFPVPSLAEEVFGDLAERAQTAALPK